LDDQEISTLQNPCTQECHGKLKGISKFPEYSVWRHMISRCYNPKDISYKYYGGRGIQVCGRWKHCFQNFIEDMGRRPVDHLSKFTLERINNDGNYEPENCKWLLQEEQWLNRRKADSYKSTIQYDQITCQGIGCTNKIIPTRKNQLFHSDVCRKRFWKIARAIGAKVLTSLKNEIS
jgi:hypothetical protein